MSRRKTGGKSFTRGGTQLGVTRVNSRILIETVGCGSATGTKPFSAGSTSNLVLNPLALGGSVSEMAALFTQWRVVRSSFEYIPAMAAGTMSGSSGVIAIGFIADGDEASATLNPTFTQIAQIKGSQVIPLFSGPPKYRMKTGHSTGCMEGGWMYTTADNSSNTLKEREDAYGVLFGQYDYQPFSTSVIHGYIFWHYGVEFRGPKFQDTVTVVNKKDEKKIKIEKKEKEIKSDYKTKDVKDEDFSVVDYCVKSNSSNWKGTAPMELDDDYIKYQLLLKTKVSETSQNKGDGVLLRPPLVRSATKT